LGAILEKFTYWSVRLLTVNKIWATEGVNGLGGHRAGEGPEYVGG